MQPYLFLNRSDAAAKLTAALPTDIDGRWLVLGVPRGGVPAAAEIACHLGSTLDLVIVRKVGAPGNPELAIAAVTGPGDDQIVINKSVQGLFGLTDADIRELALQSVKEVEARRRMWTRSGETTPLQGRDVLIVDDGAATGTTLEAAIQAVRQQGARAICVALPVALPGALVRLSASDVRFVCLHQPEYLSSVGAAYRDFPQVSDQEVVDLLSNNRTTEK